MQMTVSLSYVQSVSPFIHLGRVLSVLTPWITKSLESDNSREWRSPKQLSSLLQQVSNSLIPPTVRKNCDSLSPTR